MSTSKIAIAILGPTASGKTKLGVAMARAYLGEVISVDSLQCYKPGSIVTARPTAEEMCDVPHHLVGYLEADEEPSDFVSRAVASMDDISSRDRLPILVGGSTSLTLPLLQAALNRGYRMLAVMLAPHPSTYQRLVESRADEMLQMGLLRELAELRRLEETMVGAGAGCGRGVWKTIGYREFLPYLRAVGWTNGNSNGSAGTDEDLREKGRRSMNASTLQYGQYQLEWARHTLMPFLQRHTVATISLCVTDKESWESDVEGPAMTMAGEFCYGSRTMRLPSRGPGPKKRVVCLFGGSSSGNEAKHIDAAKSLGVALHRHGISLVYGGGTTGIMGAVARMLVALSGPDAVHGIVPAALARYEDMLSGGRLDDDERVARFGRRTVVRDMHTRKRLMTRAVVEGAPGSGFVAMSGGYGTMEELLESTTWFQLGIHSCRISVLSVDGFYDGLVDWIREAGVGSGFVGHKDADIIRVARTADEVIANLSEQPAFPRLGLEWL